MGIVAMHVIPARMGSVSDLAIELDDQAGFGIEIVNITGS